MKLAIDSDAHNVGDLRFRSSTGCESHAGVFRHTAAKGFATEVSGMLIFRTPIAKTDRVGATESNCTRITAIDIFDALGYRGCGGEEHSGENSPVESEDLLGELADNRPWQIRGVRYEH